MKMECNRQKNISRCSCTYEPCSRKGVCCECIEYHKKSGELPGCVFPSSAEKTFNRSNRYFAELQREGKV